MRYSTPQALKPPRKASWHDRNKLIYSKKYKVVLTGGIELNIFDADKRGLITVFYDKHLNNYSFIEKATGDVTSYFLGFPECSWPDWLKDHMEERTTSSPPQGNA